MSLQNLGKYELLDILGHGTSGNVWLAKDPETRRRVAIKLVETVQDREAFLYEANITASLDHPHIVRLHNTERIAGKDALVMEYMDAKTLRYRLENTTGNRLPISDALRVVAQLLMALEYAHSNAVVHGDVKPTNVLFNSDGTVKLGDFGSAKVLTKTATIFFGTHGYMAPEEYIYDSHATDAERNAANHLKDIWAIGVVLYEALTGRLPFQISNSQDPTAWKQALQQSPHLYHNLSRTCLPHCKARSVTRCK